MQFLKIDGRVEQTRYDDETLAAFGALPEDRRPVLLDATDPLVVAYLAAQPTAKSLAWARIKAERDRRKAGGFKVGSLWYHSDEASRGQNSI